MRRETVLRTTPDAANKQTGCTRIGFGRSAGNDVPPLEYQNNRYRYKQ